MYALGYDIGSSSIKAALVDANTMAPVHVVKYPEFELPISSPNKDWAEQNPEDWWSNLIQTTEKLLSESGASGDQIASIGISYQMHGLVLVDKDYKVLRPSIIWCDSRAVAIGDKAWSILGADFCLNHLLNSPGNFTASKLKWVKYNEPELFKKIHKVMLPGDYVAMKLTGEIKTTIGGLSEGIFWDFKKKSISDDLLDHYGFDSSILPELVDGIGVQGMLTPMAAKALGLKAGTPVAYRAGDQPNNAMSLNVLKPGEVAATGGTSGVIYGVTDKPLHDKYSRVNGFAHVNYSVDDPTIGILLCINGAGIQYSWVRKMLDSKRSYESMEEESAKSSIGSEGLTFLPFGNGAERILENKAFGSHLMGINFNQHKKEHIFRATLEGIAFAFVYGAEIMKDMGVVIQKIKVGNDNLFQSDIFSQTIATLLNSEIEVYNTTGAIGAAKASAVGVGLKDSLEQAMGNQELLKRISPEKEIAPYQRAFDTWKSRLETQLNS